MGAPPEGELCGDQGICVKPGVWVLVIYKSRSSWVWRYLNGRNIVVHIILEPVGIGTCEVTK